MALFECLMRKKTKEPILSSSPKLKDKDKREGPEKKGQWLDFLVFRERRCAFSLDLRSIGLSLFDGARSKVALYGEGYAWTPIWWSSNNFNR